MDVRKQAATSNLIRVVLKHATTGQGLTGLTSASAGLIISTIADVEATPTIYAQASSNIEAVSTLGTFSAPTASKCRFSQVDATNHPGLYEIQIADARFAVSNSKRLVVSWSGATNLLAGDYEIRLVKYDPDDAVRLGLTALPNAAAEAAGGLYTRGSGAGQINQAANGQVDGNLVAWRGTTPNTLQSGRVDSYLGAAAAAVIASGTFAANALDAVWSAATRTLTATDAAGVRAAVGLASANLDTQLAAILAKWTSTIADSVHADGTRPSPEQALYFLVQMLTEQSRSGTTVTVKKVDGSTTLATLTVDDATTPTAITRTT